MRIVRFVAGLGLSLLSFHAYAISSDGSLRATQRLESILSFLDGPVFTIMTVGILFFTLVHAIVTARPEFAVLGAIMAAAINFFPSLAKQLMQGQPGHISSPEPSAVMTSADLEKSSGPSFWEQARSYVLENMGTYWDAFAGVMGQNAALVGLLIAGLGMVGVFEVWRRLEKKPVRPGSQFESTRQAH